MKIKIENFKPFNEKGLEIHLAPITLLYGRNNSGKTSVLQALDLASRVIRREEISPAEFQSLVHRQEIDREIVIEIPGVFHVTLRKDSNTVTIVGNEHWIRDFKFVDYNRPRGVKAMRPIFRGIRQSNFVGIENPEMSLHPKMQLHLAEYFLKSIRQNPNQILILDTHSEHIMLRFLRRIREVFENAVEGTVANKEDFAVNYLMTRGGITQSSLIPVTGDGDFLCYWPEGFFNERANELF